MEQDRDLLSPKPYWKEFRFDLTQVPAGEAVTAAEFRIYKCRGVTPRHGNSSLHISIYEVAAQHSNRSGAGRGRGGRKGRGNEDEEGGSGDGVEKMVWGGGDG